MSVYSVGTNKSSINNFPSVRPSLDLDFANTKALDPRITFTRSSGGSYVGADGLIKYAGVNEPRFDHNPTTGESLGLLVEESRTNLLLRSEEFDSASWSRTNFRPFGSGSVANATVDPTGNSTADLLVETADASSTTHTFSQILSVTSGTTYTLSVFAKIAPGPPRRISVFVPNTNFTVTASAVFNLQTGTIATSTNTTALIVPMGNGWYRCSVVSPVATSSGSNGFSIRFDDGTTGTYIGDGTSGIYLWGAQVEVGAFPTSYIPTTTSSRTRAADNATMTGRNFSSWYRQDEGTMFASSLSYGATNSNRRIAFATDGTASNRFGFLYNGSNAPQFLVSSAGTLIAIPSVALKGANYAIASAYKLNDYAIIAAGSKPSTDTSGALPVGINQLNIGNQTFIDYVNGTIRRITYWPKRLPNSQLQALTR